ncbi:MAG TPA: trypsin-like peptidase domain-containing protein [Polyangiaceae bacterium]|nr:trypsin-like peptidase domain-containing protein [Polyangiaceae bacterium]
MTFRYLDDEHMASLRRALRDAGLAEHDVLDSLAVDLPHAIRAVVNQTRIDPIDRLMRTLGWLNAKRRDDNGTVPLLLWLKNAAFRVEGIDQAAAEVVQRALAEVSAKASGFPTDGGRARLAAGAVGQRERIVHSDDLLPYRFLERGAKAGRSVARLVVERFDGGQPTHDDQGKPWRSVGTSWLLTRDLIVTNHHVINARNDGERPAPQSDLELQSCGALAQFDFDAKGQEDQMPVRVRGLEAFSPLDGRLDYAILRLDRPLDRAPLQLAGRALELRAAPVGATALNIIQHPNGWYKQVACRNNLAHRADEHEIWYFTDTMVGSSGAPVFDDEWRVVALHKMWRPADNVLFQGKTTAWVNVGTQMTAVLQDLGRQGKVALLEEIARAPERVTS